ncbi:MAG: N-acetyltransferase [Alphaproteobacteria bacterium HGW-Alphaproteobacteria-4]|jgi:RimJ/RimL family protein N-acetyltransferase|nr:MAG: N-acetyltransferase [Alphaproteobacteria bacterium HGW-Alphaproteobacteria-4]
MIALTGTPVLETERLVLRAPGPADWPQWLAYFGTERSRYSGGPLAADRAWRAFCHHLGHWVMRGYGSFAVTLKGGADAIGLVGPYHPIDWPEPEIGWALWNPMHQGKGLAFEAATASLDFVFRTLRWRTVVSYIDPTNLRSVALARRLGAMPDPVAPRPHPDDLVFRHRNPLGAA